MKLFKKLFLSIGLLPISLLAVGNIPASSVYEYKVTIKKLEVYNSTTAKWIVVSGGAAKIDIASANAGQNIGAMISEDAAFTYGRYTKARATIGNTFDVKACTTTPNASCSTSTMQSGGHTIIVSCTESATPTSQTMVVDFSDTTNVTLPPEASVVGSDVQVEYILPTPLVINENSTAPNITLSFDVDNVLKSTTLGNDTCGVDGDDDNYIIVDFPRVNIDIQ